jgi:hypothetical protein
MRTNADDATRVAPIGTSASNPASIQNAACKPVALAMKPMPAGPARMPAYAVVLMAAMARPGGIDVCVDARRKNTGTMFEQPTPISAKPTRATAAPGAVSNTTKPASAITPPATSVFRSPKRALIASPPRRHTVIAMENTM